MSREKSTRKPDFNELQAAVEKERTRIAGDLHDELGSNLTRILLLAERGEMEIHAGKIAAYAREAVQTLDEIVWAVDPENDTVDGFVAYISQYANRFFENTNTCCRLEMPVESSSVPVPAETRHNLFLAVKEALNNVLKHSGATVARVRVSETASAVEIAIEDNGRGFDAEKTRGGRKGRGLGNMRKRIENLGGQFSIAGVCGQGTRLKITCPTGRKAG